MENEKSKLLLIELFKKLKDQRKKMNLTQEQLADKCGFDRTYISLLERGKRNPTYLNLLKLCKALNIDIEFLPKGNKK